ncbi:hypothetical protein CY34DRAFT_163021 [Suillus luteus UH-Slu-Lm8-n1]|uniref:Uncharacterized protein n=1 Tax=Suillus luteus UH-Slu-Lm8-n1 TaxID=930992 RepID=A0A0D0AJS5_9AGAM|nr:hypothetical protein CY34DRAFT_163021 [Suillus luteus UH-Slu-Lm8-n1]
MSVTIYQGYIGTSHKQHDHLWPQEVLIQFQLVSLPRSLSRRSSWPIISMMQIVEEFDSTTHKSSEAPTSSKGSVRNFRGSLRPLHSIRDPFMYPSASS